MANQGPTAGGGRTVLHRRHTPQQPKTQVQRRSADRKPAHKQIFVQRYSEGVACKPETATIIDISVVGIGVILAVPMNKGDEFSIHLKPLDFNLLYRVVHCRVCGDASHRVGAEFLHCIDGKAGSLQQDIDRIRQAVLA